MEPSSKAPNTRPKQGEDVHGRRGDAAAGGGIHAADIALVVGPRTASGCSINSCGLACCRQATRSSRRGKTAAEGQIFDANRPMLLGCWRSRASGLDSGPCSDDARGRFAARLDAAQGEVDAIPWTRVVRRRATRTPRCPRLAFREAGALDLWSVFAVKPGRPLRLACGQGPPGFALAGNPVAAMSCTLIIRAPLCVGAVGRGRLACAHKALTWSQISAKLKKPGDASICRARMRDGRVTGFASERVGRISRLSWAEGLRRNYQMPQPTFSGASVRYIPLMVSFRVTSPSRTFPATRPSNIKAPHCGVSVSAEMSAFRLGLSGFKGGKGAIKAAPGSDCATSRKIRGLFHTRNLSAPRRTGHGCHPMPQFGRRVAPCAN